MRVAVEYPIDTAVPTAPATFKVVPKAPACLTSPLNCAASSLPAAAAVAAPSANFPPCCTPFSSNPLVVLITLAAFSAGEGALEGSELATSVFVTLGLASPSPIFVAVPSEFNL